MKDDVFIAISTDALLSKSKAYIHRALARKSNDDLDEYQLWASLTLELLGKAFLASKHPSLIVDPQHWQSLFVAAGIQLTTDIKTITAKTLFERLKHAIILFDSDIQNFCLRISERRNAELHSGDVPFKHMNLDAWEQQYWYACYIILKEMDLTLEEWLGAHDAKTPRRILQEAERALESSVLLRIQKSIDYFNSLSISKKQAAINSADSLLPHVQKTIFSRPFSQTWQSICPACKSKAFMAGEQVYEEISEYSDSGDMWELVNREFIGEEFQCIACQLSLDSTREIEKSGLSSIYTDQEERPLEYEPEYGND